MMTRIAPYEFNEDAFERLAADRVIGAGASSSGQGRSGVSRWRKCSLLEQERQPLDLDEVADRRRVANRDHSADKVWTSASRSAAV
jgi:hypothetical protein